MTVPQGTGGGLPERAWPPGDPAAEPDRPAADLAAGMGLVSVSFLGAALRRRARLWCAAAVAGLLCGAAFYLSAPPAYQASTSVLLTHAPTEDPTDAMQTDAVLSQSRAVAGRVLHDLGLPESPTSFIASATATAVTDRVLALTVSAPSASEAARRTRALATAFLQFRAGQLWSQQRLVLAALNQQIDRDKRQVSSLTKQITAVPAQPASPTQRARLTSLLAQRVQVRATLAGLQNATTAYPVTTVSMVAGSKVLDAAAPVPRSHLKVAVVDAVLGLAAGLALGMGIIVVGALTSSRLRRRDDVAVALGAPVSLSVGHIRAGRRLPGRPRLKAARSHDAQRVTAYLGRAVPDGSRGTAALAVVAVDNARAVALPVVSLALSCAREGREVVVADLAAGAPAARLLGVKKPGVSAVSLDGAELRVAVPGGHEIMPAGPLRRGLAHPQPALAGDGAGPGVPPADGLAAACASADLLLSLVTLDPALGAEHLAGWAAAATVVVTAGRSSSTRISAVGDMIRLAGTPLAGAVLAGADKTDESLGMTYAQAQWARRAQGPGAAGPGAAGR